MAHISTGTGMEDTTQNTIVALVHEVSRLKELLGSVVKVVKYQQEKLIELQGMVGPGHVPDSVILAHERLRKCESKYKKVFVPPKCVALAMYYYYKEKLPKRRILDSGLLSQGQLYKVLDWDMQYLEDYCTVSGVLDIYNNGVDADTLKELVKKPDQLERKQGGK